MSTFQKYAGFQLIVTLTTLVVVLALFLIPATNSGYLAGFSILSLLGFGEFYFKRSGRTPIEDERDDQINRKAIILAYTAFWICFVGWGVIISLVFSTDGAVPLDYVEPIVFFAWCLVTLVHSTMVLVFYRLDL